MLLFCMEAEPASTPMRGSRSGGKGGTNGVRLMAGRRAPTTAGRPIQQSVCLLYLTSAVSGEHNDDMRDSGRPLMVTVNKWQTTRTIEPLYLAPCVDVQHYTRQFIDGYYPTFSEPYLCF